MIQYWAIKFLAICLVLVLVSSNAYAQCVSPAGNEGDTMYNKHFSVMQYCDDTNWIAMGNADTGLVGYWRLDETSGTTAVDSSVNTNNGTMNGGLDASNDAVTGVIDSALNFDGNDYISTGAADLIDNETEASLCAWTYFPSPLPNNVNYVVVDYFGSGDGWGLYYDGLSNSDSMIFRPSWVGGVNSLVQGPSGDVATDTWEHYCGVFIGSTSITLYKNGVQIAQNTTSPPADIGTNASSNLAVGGRDPGSFYFNGNLDDVRVYDRALLPAEITALYNAGRDRGLVGHWKLDETGATTTAIDSSVNANSGIMTGGLSGTDSVTGKVNTALNLDGTDDYILYSGGIQPINDFTYTAWVYPEAAGAMTFFAFTESSNNELLIRRTGSERLGVNIDGNFSAIVGSDDISINQWSHIAVRRIGSTIRLYLDGQWQATGSDGDPLNNTCNLLIGVDADAGCTGALGEFMNGQIDDARVYNRGLSDDEIRALYREKFTLCDSPNGYEGEIIYNDANDVMQFCNSTEWMGMGPAGDGGAGCSNPTGAAGDMIYNDGATVMTYCEGDAWIAIGK